MSAADGVSLQEQRWNAWMDKANKMFSYNGYHTPAYQTFCVKGAQASHSEVTLPTFLISLVVGALVMFIICRFSCNSPHDWDIDVNCNTFIAGTTTVSLLFFLSIFVACWIVSKNKKEILDDADEKGSDLYARTLQTDEAYIKRLKDGLEASLQGLNQASGSSELRAVKPTT